MFKSVIRNGRIKKDGYRVYIRVNKDRKVLYIKTHLYVAPSRLDKKGNIKDIDYIDACNAIIREYRDTLSGKDIRSLTLEQICGILTKTTNKKIDFVYESQQIIDSLKKDYPLNAKSLQTSLNSFKKFAGDSIDINQITGNLISNYAEHIKHIRSNAYLSGIRNLFNRIEAKYNDYDLNVIAIKTQPFRRIKIKPIQYPSRAVSPDTIRTIINLKDTHTNCSKVAMDMFLISFYLCGMNLIDIWNCKNVGERITYYRTKVKNRRQDKGVISVKVEPEAKEIIDKYIKNKEFVFNQDNYNALQIFITKGMKEISEMIKEKVTFYSARHSWATIARNKCGVDKYTVHEALNHVDSGTRITDIYIERDYANIDIANRKVIDYIKNKEKN